MMASPSIGDVFPTCPKRLTATPCQEAKGAAGGNGVAARAGQGGTLLSIEAGFQIS